MKRKGYSRRADIPADLLAQLNAGALESATLTEGLAIDFVQLMHHTVPAVADFAASRIHPSDGITKRMAVAGELLLEHLGPEGYHALVCHPADTVRGWAAYMLPLIPKLSLQERLEWARPLANDPHFGVREWAWLALRPQIAAQVEAAITSLTAWVEEDSANLRRFAVESTRPRGVWCPHIQPLKQNPALGLPLLEPVKADSARYVQDSVANWLRDAAKSQPIWVQALCDCWRSQSHQPPTLRICQRALRNLQA